MSYMATYILFLMSGQNIVYSLQLSPDQHENWNALKHPKVWKTESIPFGYLFRKQSSLPLTLDYPELCLQSIHDVHFDWYWTTHFPCLIKCKLMQMYHSLQNSERLRCRDSFPESLILAVLAPSFAFHQQENGKKVGVCQTARTPNQPNFPHRPERESDFMSEMNAIPNWDHCTWQFVPKSFLQFEPLSRFRNARCLRGQLVNGGTGQKWGGRTKKGGVRVKNISVSVHNLYELNWETRRARWVR